MGSHAAPGGPRLDGPRRPPVIRWNPPDDTPWAMTPEPGAANHERAKAKIVVGLTFACTVLSLYDLYLLGTGF